MRDQIARELLAKVGGYASSEDLRRTRAIFESMGMDMSGRRATKYWTSVITLYSLRYQKMAQFPPSVSGSRYVDANQPNPLRMINYRGRMIRK
jgi:hypothetical protein